MKKILNLTQHPATPEQIQAGVVEPANKERVKTLLTFDELPSTAELYKRAAELARICQQHGTELAMVGGAPFFMRPLHIHLDARGIAPLYAFSKRESVEEKLADGTVKKTAVFKHIGFVGGG